MLLLTLLCGSFLFTAGQEGSVLDNIVGFSEDTNSSLSISSVEFLESESSNFSISFPNPTTAADMKNNSTSIQYPYHVGLRVFVKSAQNVDFNLASAILQKYLGFLPEDFTVTGRVTHIKKV